MGFLRGKFQLKLNCVAGDGAQDQWKKKQQTLLMPSSNKTQNGTSLKLTQKTKQNILHLGVVAIEKGAFGLPSTMVANFTYLLYWNHKKKLR